MTPYIPSAYVDKMSYEPAWAMDSRSRTLIRRRLWFGRLGWLVATLLGAILLWRASMQQREMNDPLQRLDAVEQAEQVVLDGSTYEAQRDSGRRQNLMVGVKDTGSHRTDDQNVPKSMTSERDRDVEARNLPLLDRQTKAKTASWANMKNLFVFGDSYTATGLTRDESDPVEANPLDDAGHFSVTRPVWIDFVLQIYNESIIPTVNFAVGGSTTDSTIVEPFIFGTSLRDQITDNFLPKYTHRHVPGGPTWIPQSTLFAIWIGVNDIAMHYGRHPSPTAPGPSLPAIFASYKSSLLALHAAGARHFLLLTVPPFDRSLKVPETAEEWQRRGQTVRDIASFNARIFDMAELLRERLKKDAVTGVTGVANEDGDGGEEEVQIHVFDAHRLYSRVLDDPAAFEQTEDIVDTESICQEVEIFGNPAARAASTSTSTSTSGNTDDAPDTDTSTYYWNALCTDGGPVLAHAWTYLHATSRMHDVTGAKVMEDCMGVGGWRGFCV